MRTQTTMAHIPDPTSFYASHKRLVMQLAGKWSTKHGLDISDLESVGNEVFWNCMRKWDPDKSKFSTFLYKSLCNRFSNFIKKEKIDPGSPLNYPINMDDYWEKEGGTEAQPHDPLWLEGVISALTEDAREVVRLLFDGDIGTVISDNHVFVRAALKKTLGKEWHDARIARAFKSITKAL